MGADFKGAVQGLGHGTLARDSQNQIVVVSEDRAYSTVVDRSLTGISNPVEFQRWISSIDQKQLPEKSAVREGSEQAADPELAKLMKDLHTRQAEESFRTTKIHDMRLDPTKAPDQRLLQLNMQAKGQQSAAFEDERSRYIQEHHEAKRISDGLREEEKKLSLNPELGSKFYR